MAVEQMSPGVLATILLKNAEEKDASKREDIVVIDVRDDDWKGGNIKGSINVPSWRFPDKLEDLLKEHKDRKAIVFHCMFSQQRGPRAARAFSQALASKHKDSKCKVYYLTGGWRAWAAAYIKSEKRDLLIENLHPKVWG
mmetsp:Transcript_8199/g.16023  ORF Transcript_8199/g.16023 Transcript_8199/m.16023 type:complete len:140 (-) Transcript_8199:192-611(-)